MTETRDRTAKDIIVSMMHLITTGKIKGQFARDLEKLCIIAKRAEDDKA